jgi:hypothetical protein
LNVTRNTASGCDWSASTSTPWITLTGNRSGTSPGTITYSVAQNTDSAARFKYYPGLRGTPSTLFDGKNDAGEYIDDKNGLTVRVSLGLKPQFEKTLLWSLNALGNVLRRLGRDGSARRLLTVARRCAMTVGSIRGELVISGNLITASKDARPPERSAQESWSVAERCFAWGMTSDGLVHSIGAAIYGIYKIGFGFFINYRSR